MAYTITVTKRNNDIPEGEIGQPIDNNGQKMYRFETDTGMSDYVSLSWDYIRKNKDYFSVSTKQD